MTNTLLIKNDIFPGPAHCQGTVTIIGGGIIGLSSAYYLQQSGWKVTIIDKSDFKNNCSYGNAGYVCPSHFTPLATPGIAKQGLRWMLNSQSPFYIQPRFNRGLIDWGIKFIKSATSKHVENSAVPLRDIALLSQQEYEKWASIFDFSYTRKGVLEIFQTKVNEEHAKHTVEKALALGLDAELLNYQQLQSLEPETKMNASGAIHFKCDAHVSPDLLMKNLMSLLQERNVRFIKNEEVTGFESNGKRVSKVLTKNNAYDTDYVLLAAGAWSKEIAAQLNIKIPLVAGRGYSLTVENKFCQLRYPAILVEGRAAVTPLRKNILRFGGTMEITSTSAPIRMNRVKGLINTIRQFYPDFSMSVPPIDKVWHGYRPCSADGLPYIGKVKGWANLVVATGHSMLGISLGPATGKLVDEIISEKKISIDTGAFAAERFG